MSKFHSIVSRRDFMKGLGLAGVGVGAAAAVAPVFHDLDELVSTSNSSPKRAWWIKEVDHPTVDIDWDLMQRHEGGHSTQSSAIVSRYTGVAEYNAMALPRTNQQRLEANEPGYRLRDVALSDAHGNYPSATYTYDAAGRTVLPVKKPAERGVPKWTGTPEEATRMVRAAMVFFGAAAIGTAEINEHHKKLIGLTGDNIANTYFPPTWPPPTTVTKPMVFANQPEFTYDSKTAITTIPSNIPLWSITYAVPQDTELNRCRPTVLGQVAQIRYRLKANIMWMTQNFVQALGYQTLRDNPYRAVPSQSGAVLGGLAETGRHSLNCVSPEFGMFIGNFDMMTDLPLAETKPIDAGIWRFCRTCGLCAESCPSGSIEPKGGREISFEPYPSSVAPKHAPLPGTRSVGEYHKLGCKRYWTDMISCAVYRRTVSSCLLCQGACVFNGANSAMIHQVVKGTLATTPLFNGFFANMHGVFGYGLKEGEDIEGWWDMSLPSYGFSSTIMARHMGY